MLHALLSNMKELNTVTLVLAFVTSALATGLPCRNELVAITPKSPPGAFSPKCRPSGLFEVQQCHGSTGHCWCVDQVSGQQIEGTETPPTVQRVDCTKYALTCQAEETAVVEALGGQMMPGAFLPQCDPQNPDRYNPQQNYGSTGTNWCVSHVTGIEIPGTRLVHGQTRQTPCEDIQARAQITVATLPCHQKSGRSQERAGAFSPKCRPSGLFEVQQCHGSTGHCWCVDQVSGQQIEGTETPPYIDYVDCTKYALACRDEREAVLEALGGHGVPGAYVPQCNTDDAAKYNPLQVNSSTGSNWCVNPVTGVELQGTHLERDQSRAVPCEDMQASSLSSTGFPCLEQEQTRSQLIFAHSRAGGFHPQCRQSGLFEARQCHWGTGRCWCVHQRTGEQIEGTETLPGQDMPDCKPYALSCPREKAAVMEVLGGHMRPGAFVPQCEEDHYKAEQIHGSTGQSWCVEPLTGIEIHGTRLLPGENRDTPCEARHATDSPGLLCREQAAGSKPIPGAYISQCTNSGIFKVQQCHGSTGYCWCVDQVSGKAIEGTITPPTLERKDCNAYALPCDEEKAAVLEALGGQIMPGAYVPQCTAQSQSRYKPLQIHGSTGVSWCVHVVTGVELPGTRLSHGQIRHTPCEAMQTAPMLGQGFPCLDKQLMSVGSMTGGYRPQCRPSGIFEVRQCHGSTGRCWCVDQITGEKIEGTETLPGQTLPDCKAYALSCPREKAAVMEALGGHMMPGAFVPQCEEDHYKAEQIYGSTGQSWCVYKDNGTEIDHTRLLPGQNREFPCEASPLLVATGLLCKEKAANTKTIPGAYFPQCTNSGIFQVQQCHGSTGYCWCVDQVSGEEIENTRTPPTAPKKDCSPFALTCKEERLAVMSSVGTLIGTYIPLCKGEHHNCLQKHPSTGSSWCVNPITGEEIPGSRVGRGQVAVCGDMIMTETSGATGFRLTSRLIFSLCLYVIYAMMNV